MRVTLFVPCFMDAVYPAAAMSMVRVLEELGHDVDVPEGVTCCGQPPFNSGYWDEARAMARPVVRALEGAEAVVIGSGSCGAMLKVFYGEMFAGRAGEEMAARELAGRVWEFSAFLVERLGVTDVGASFGRRVTFHDGCHGLRELGIWSAPRKLLGAVRGLELVEMAGGGNCCGFGGSFAVKNAAISVAMGEEKCGAALATGADVMVSNDASCLLHLRGLLDRGGRPLHTMHLAEVLVQRS